jgi:hypothetical protein
MEVYISKLTSDSDVNRRLPEHEDHDDGSGPTATANANAPATPMANNIEEILILR